VIARSSDAVFSHRATGRVPLSLPGQGGTHVHYSHRVSFGIGKITSRPKGSLSTEEFLAIQYGLTLEQVRGILQKGTNG
jgi:hypothetical protein